MKIMSIFLKPEDSTDFAITFLMVRSSGLFVDQQTFVGSSVDFKGGPIAG